MTCLLLIMMHGLMRKAYGATVILLVNSQLDFENGTLDGNGWFNMLVIVMFSLGGATGPRYDYILTEEVSHLAAGNYSSERVCWFSVLLCYKEIAWSKRVLMFAIYIIGVLHYGERGN